MCEKGGNQMPTLNQLAQTLQETAYLHRLCLSLYTEPTLASHHDGTSRHGSVRLTQQEQWLNTRDHMAEQWQRIETIAAELSWRGQTQDGDPARYIATRLTWAEHHYPYMHDLQETAQEVHNYFQTLARENDSVTEHLCPMCGKAQLHYRERDQQFYCTECDGTWTASQLQALRHYRIVSAGQWITIKEATAQYGIPQQTIYTWIRRHKLERNTQGQINTAQFEQLC